MVEPRIKYLRDNATAPERLVWGQLRRKRVGNLRFRRQFRLGPYIVDFVCLPARLIVEIDGASHDLTNAADVRRATWLEAQGFQVLRFTNELVLHNLEGVVRTITLAVADSARPSPYPPPARGGGTQGASLANSHKRGTRETSGEGGR